MSWLRIDKFELENGRCEVYERDVIRTVERRVNGRPVSAKLTKKTERVYKAILNPTGMQVGDPTKNCRTLKEVYAFAGKRVKR